MRLVQALFVSLVLIAASTATFAQSKISGKSELDVKAKMAFPFTEKQFGALKWKEDGGGLYTSYFVTQRQHDFECDYSCTVDVDLDENDFWYQETRDEGEPSEHRAYLGYGEGAVTREGNFWPRGDCGFQAEFTANIHFEVLDFVNEEWVDLLLVFAPEEEIEGPDRGWGPCFPPPAEASVTP
jgi:hypothetical protein